MTTDAEEGCLWWPDHLFSDNIRSDDILSNHVLSNHVLPSRVLPNHVLPSHVLVNDLFSDDLLLFCSVCRPVQLFLSSSRRLPPAFSRKTGGSSSNRTFRRSVPSLMPTSPLRTVF